MANLQGISGQTVLAQTTEINTDTYAEPNNWNERFQLILNDIATLNSRINQRYALSGHLASATISNNAAGAAVAIPLIHKTGYDLFLREANTTLESGFKLRFTYARQTASNGLSETVIDIDPGAFVELNTEILKRSDGSGDPNYLDYASVRVFNQSGAQASLGTVWRLVFEYVPI